MTGFHAPHLGDFASSHLFDPRYGKPSGSSSSTSPSPSSQPPSPMMSSFHLPHWSFHAPHLGDFVDEHLFDPHIGHPKVSTAPQVDIHKDPVTNLMTAEIRLPRTGTSSIHVDVGSDNKVVISGDADHEQHSSGSEAEESSNRRILCTIKLPKGVTAQDISAHMEGDVLLVMYPRVHVQHSPLRIPIS